MEDRINNLQGGLWIGFTCVLALALAGNAVMALLGYSEFATWHLPLLAISCYLSWDSLTARQRRRVSAFMRLMRIRAAKAARSFPFSNVTRAVRGLAALIFIGNRYNRPRTQP